MITMRLFTIVLEKESTGEAALYYNYIKKQWVSHFQLGCGCVNKKEAEKALKEADIIGAYILEGDVNLSEEEEQ